MYDFHVHSRLSYDTYVPAVTMAQAAARAGLKEICFTDHIDYVLGTPREDISFSQEAYGAELGNLHVPGLTIRRGAELGLTDFNAAEAKADAQALACDFIIGSVHHLDNLDIYEPEWWQGKTVEEAELRYLETILRRVRLHDCFDVLGHLTYISKSPSNPTGQLIPYEKYADLTDEILKVLVTKGKGLEINSSGVDRCGDFLPAERYLRRFRELGGEIVTMGSDAHTPERVGQYMGRAQEILKEVFGWVCTFTGRAPVFHKL